MPSQWCEWRQSLPADSIDFPLICKVIDTHEPLQGLMSIYDLADQLHWTIFRYSGLQKKCNMFLNHPKCFKRFLKNVAYPFLISLYFTKWFESFYTPSMLGISTWACCFFHCKFSHLCVLDARLGCVKVSSDLLEFMNNDYDQLKLYLRVFHSYLNKSQIHDRHTCSFWWMSSALL